MADSFQFLSKLLGMTNSTNENESAVAEAKLEEQLLKRGITKDQLEKKVEEGIEDPTLKEAINWTWTDEKGHQHFSRVKPHEQIIVSACVYFFNGKLVIGHSYKGKCFDIFATKGNRKQIDLYSAYLIEACERALKEERKGVRGGFDATFNSSFRKNWAWKIQSRLNKMKEAEEKDGRREVKQGKKINVRAIQVRGKNEIEQTKALSLRDQKYPKLRKGTGFTIGGAGANAGRQAGANTGLGRQVSGRQTRRIAGA
jgi:hypothetical protein